VRRVNFKFLLILILGIATAAGGIWGVRRLQVARHAGGKRDLARQQLDEGKVAQAMELLAQYVSLRPDDHEAFADYAVLLLARATSPDASRNDVARAFNALETAVRRNPDNDELRRQLAEFQLRVGRFSDSREHLDVLEKRSAARSAEEPANPQFGIQVRLLKANAHLGSNEFEEAAGLVAELVGYDLANRQFLDGFDDAGVPTDAYVLLAAILLDRMSAPADAQVVFETLVARRPEDVRARLALGTWQRDRGRLAEAAESIAKASSLAPDDLDCVFAEFELALTTRDWERAEASAERAVELFPGEERAYRGLASVAMQLGDLRRAERVLLDGVERLPGRPSLLLMLTDALLQQNKLTEASQAIARIRELYGSTSPAVGLLESRLLVAERRWTEAKTKLEQIRPLVLGNTDLIRQVDLYLGQCHAQLDEFDAQLEVNRRILSEDPNSLAARAGAAQALMSAGQRDQALAEFESIAANLPLERIVEIPQVWYPLLQLRIGRQSGLPAQQRDWSVVDDLLTALESGAKLSPSQFALLRAETLVRKGEPQLARQLLAGAVDDASEPQLWSALATLILREEGSQAVLEMLAAAPPAVQAAPSVLAIEAQALAREPRERAREGLIAVEQRGDRLPAADAAKIFEMLASMRLAMGEPEEAERLLRSALAKQPDDLGLRESLLDLAVATGDPEKARGATAEIGRIAGKTAARARVAEATVNLLEARGMLVAAGEAINRWAGGGPGRQTPAQLPAAVKALLDQARSLLAEAEAERPGWSRIQTLAADIDELRGDRGAAIERLKRAVASGSVNPSAVRRLVAMLYSANRLEEAQQAMGMLGTEGMTGLERISAEAELRAGKFDEAVALAEQSVAGDTQNVDDLLWLGQLLARSGKGERAGEVLERAVEVGPESPDAWLALFSHRLASANPAAAEVALRTAATLIEPPRRQLALAQGYEMLDRPAEAERMFQEALAGWPEDLEAIRGFAAFDIRRGRPEKARGLLERILAAGGDEAAPAKAWARRVLAELTAQQGSARQLEAALTLLRQNRGRDGKASEEDLGLEIALLTNRPEPANWRRAIGLLGEVAALQPLTTAQKLLRAQLLEKTGQWDEARDELVALVAKAETPPAYVALLVEKLIEHGEITTAKTWLRRLQQAAPDSAITIAIDAKLAMAENDRPRAIESARRLMPGGEFKDENPARLAAVGQLMTDLGFPKAADRVFDHYASVSEQGILARIDFLSGQGRSDEALAILEERWESMSLERALAFGLGVVRSEPADAKAAKAAVRVRGWIDKARRVDPESLVIRLLDAELTSLEGREPEAERLYRQLLADTRLEAGQRAIVANNLAFHLAAPKTAAEARTLIDGAIEEVGPLPDLLDTRGLVRLAAGDAAGAVADLREAVLQPSAVKFMHLAVAELAAGDERAARVALERARKNGLPGLRMSPADSARLRDLEKTLGPATDTAAAAGT